METEEKVSITYRDLLNFLQSVPEEDLDQTATIDLVGSDEIIAIQGIARMDEEDEDRLDPGHIVLYVED